MITFFLGVGDRHLDNILMTTAGELFHVDYGFILGKDPKPLPSPVRITMDMIEGMGGTDSQGFHQFLGFAQQAYRVLRRYAPLLINLMTPAVMGQHSAISFLYQRLRLDLDDEQATHFFENTIRESCKAVMPQLMEKLHTKIQRARK